MAFVSVNDPFVMKAWEEAQGAKGKVLMLSDGNGDLAASVRHGLDRDYRNNLPQLSQIPVPQQYRLAY